MLSAVGQSKLRFDQVGVQSVRDLTDGVLLARLIETLRGQKVGESVPIDRICAGTAASSGSRTVRCTRSNTSGGFSS